jgi:5-hydroxyisourate hydrolase-like protein (transthyretin family)
LLLAAPATAAKVELSTVELGHLTAGSYRRTEKAIDWDSQTGTGEQVGSGTYFYQLQAGNYTETRKMVILK